MENEMKFFSIDEDTMNALMELLSEAYVEACNIQDKGSVQFYAYLLGELENAKIVGKSEPLNKDEEIKMKKIERYLRMLQKGLNKPNNKEDNNKRRKFARDILDHDINKEPEIVEVSSMTPYFSTNMPLTQIEKILQGLTNLTNHEKYEIYQTEKDRRFTDEGHSLDKMCKDIGIERNKK